MEKLKNLTVFQILMMVFYSFLLYAVVDVAQKVHNQRQYDMEKILADIQKQYPKSRLTFQNIHVEDNRLKEHTLGDIHDEPYYETVSVCIKDNQLEKEPNFLWVLFCFLPLFFLTIFHEDPRTLKIKDLGKVSMHTCCWIFGSIFLSLIITAVPDQYEIRKIDPNEFSRETRLLLGKTDLNDYKKIYLND